MTMAHVGLSSQLDHLEEVAARLNAESNLLTAQIEGLESKLRDFNVGIEVWATAPIEKEILNVGVNGEPVTGTSETELGFARFKDGWHLCLRVSKYQEIGNDERETMTIGKPHVRLVDAPRNQRIAAWKLCPLLVAQLTAQANGIVCSMEEARNAVVK